MQRQLPTVVIRTADVRHVSCRAAPPIQARACGIHPGLLTFAGVAQARFGAHPSRLSYRYDAAPAARHELQCHTAQVSAT